MDVQFGDRPLFAPCNLGTVPKLHIGPKLHLGLGLEALDYAAPHSGEAFDLAGGETFRF